MNRSPNCYILFALAILFSTNFAYAEWPDVDIDLVTCQPDGVVANIKEKIDPLKFWVRQHVALEMSLEQEDLASLIEVCKIEHVDDRNEYIKCVGFMKNRHKAMIKCLRFTRKMCNQLGGNCR